MADIDFWDLHRATAAANAALQVKLKQIDQECKERHGENAHVLNHDGYYVRTLAAMHDRYSQDDGPLEWFHTRAGFRNEALARILKAMELTEGRSDAVARIHAFIKKEHLSWFRNRVRASASIKRFAETQRSESEVRSKLAERTSNPADFLKELTESAARNDAQNFQEATRYVDRLTAALANDDQKEKRNVIKEMLFSSELASGDISPEEADSRLEELGYTGNNLDAVMNVHLRQRAEADQRTAEAREQCIQRIEEIRRAQAAHQKEKAARQQKQQERERERERDLLPTADETESEIEIERDNAPSIEIAKSTFEGLLAPPLKCDVCDGKINLDGAHQCGLCFFFAAHGFQNVTPTMWCSQDCRDKGINRHIRTHPVCTAAAHYNCIWMMQRIEGRGFRPDESNVVFCKESFEEHKEFISYCTMECATKDFQHHYVETLKPRRSSMLRDSDSDEIIYEDESRTQFRARDMNKYMLSLDDERRKLLEMHGT